MPSRPDAQVCVIASHVLLYQRDIGWAHVVGKAEKARVSYERIKGSSSFKELNRGAQLAQRLREYV